MNIDKLLEEINKAKESCKDVFDNNSDDIFKYVNWCNSSMNDTLALFDKIKENLESMVEEIEQGKREESQ